MSGIDQDNAVTNPSRTRCARTARVLSPLLVFVAIGCAGGNFFFPAGWSAAETGLPSLDTAAKSTTATGQDWDSAGALTGLDDGGEQCLAAARGSPENQITSVPDQCAPAPPSDSSSVRSFEIPADGERIPASCPWETILRSKALARRSPTTTAQALSMER